MCDSFIESFALPTLTCISHHSSIADTDPLPVAGSRLTCFLPVLAGPADEVGVDGLGIFFT